MIASARGTLATKKEYPPEDEVKPEEEARIGVFVCHCGINIGGVVNVPVGRRVRRDPAQCGACRGEPLHVLPGYAGKDQKRR